MTNIIYLDNSATTRPYDDVTDYMTDIGKNYYGNPSSLHTMGIEAEKLIKKWRTTISDTLSVDAKELYFTSGGTESNNLGIRGYLSANPRKGKHIITTSIEHPSVLEVYKYLESCGYQVDYLKVDMDGMVDLGELTQKITANTSLISIIHVNNETGTIQPIEEIINIKNRINREVAIHVDAVQTYGKQVLLPKKAGIDLLSLSSHKIHGPKGVGALYINKNMKIKPVVFGGGQESLLRSGTENVPGICGFGLAARLTFDKLEDNFHKVSTLKTSFIEMLNQQIEDVRINSPENSSPYILNISFMDVKAEVLLHHLEEMNIFVSTGSACSSKKNKHSHVLKAMGIPVSGLEGAIRISFSPLNTMEEIEGTIKALQSIIPKIKITRGGRK